MRSRLIIVTVALALGACASSQPASEQAEAAAAAKKAAMDQSAVSYQWQRWGAWTPYNAP